MTPDAPPGAWIESDVPGRLELGLEASLIGNLAPTLQDPRALGLSATEVGLANSCSSSR